MELTSKRDRVLASLGRAAMAMSFYSLLVWRFEKPPFAPHIPEVLIVGVVIYVITMRARR